jgi:hypothetical protein
VQQESGEVLAGSKASPFFSPTDDAGAPLLAFEEWSGAAAPGSRPFLVLTCARHTQEGAFPARTFAEAPLVEAGGPEFHLGKKHLIPLIFHHTFLVRTSQTGAKIAAKIS